MHGRERDCDKLKIKFNSICCCAQPSVEAYAALNEHKFYSSIVFPSPLSRTQQTSKTENRDLG